jgi:PAS domain S-box-containing protein
VLKVQHDERDFHSDDGGRKIVFAKYSCFHVWLHREKRRLKLQPNRMRDQQHYPPRKSIFAFEELTQDLMQRELEMLDALFEYATEGILVCDRTGVIRMANPMAEKMFGYAQNELKGQKIEVLLPARYLGHHEKYREGYAKKPSPRAMGTGRDLYGVRKDGSEIMVEISLSPFSTTEGEFIMSFIVDITGRKKNEIELRLAHERVTQTSEALSRLNAELEEKVKERTEELADAIQRLAGSKREVMRALEREKELNELKSRFVTTASHEFRTPLGTILSSVSLISRYEDPADSDKRKKHVERIKSAVTNLTEILNDFLSLEKLEEGIISSHPTVFDLRLLVDDVAGDMRGMAKAGQEIKVSYSGGNEVYLDRQLVKNILLNLISNAIKYSPENKPISVRIQVQKDEVKMEIEDQGIGIPQDDHANIFDRFYRAKNAANIQGTGLGLNIVKKYIELMNGSVDFQSKFGEGTTFIIKIPFETLPG